MELKPDSPFINPGVTPFVECPSCKRLITHELEVCPHCREEIDPEYAKVSSTVIVYNTVACRSATTIWTVEYGALMIFVATLLGAWLVDPKVVVVNLVTPLLSMTAMIVGFRRFGWFKFGDAELEKANET